MEMKKIAYKTPSVEITFWKADDVIRTSSATNYLSSVTDKVATVGDGNVTCSADFGTELK
jgi:hypothetical protein